MEPVARRKGWLWTVCAGLIGIGGSALAWSAHPELGVALVTLEAIVVVAVLGAALFGSEVTSERAFRLLRWVANRPEPKGPPRRPRKLP
ncbi:hypothetical protein [Nonomuraea sp. NPDC049028]|uniref:hypothetical protein n=1 Tax=Nonomuraea sp. NPDC049028 TaxID=3364348 RepID=UPI003723E1E2